MSTPPRIAVCIVTYNRPASLAKTLGSLAQLRLPDAGTDVLVIDNDAQETARDTVTAMQQRFPLPLHYHVETRKGIPHARNRALELAAEYDYLAFIDDDDTAAPEWLYLLYQTVRDNNADVSKGLIAYRFAPENAHLASLGIFGNPPQQTGEELDSAWTNNVLFRTALYKETGLRFDTDFTASGGSDHHFFRTAKQHGARIVMCREAIVHTAIPVERTTTRWLGRRHLRVGATLTLSDTKALGWQKSASHVLRDSKGDIPHSFRLLKGAWHKQHSCLLPVMSGCYVLGRFLGLLRILPREYH